LTGKDRERNQRTAEHERRFALRIHAPLPPARTEKPPRSPSPLHGLHKRGKKKDKQGKHRPAARQENPRKKSPT